MKKTLVSGLFIHPGKVGGAEQYFYNLLKGFKSLSAQDNFVVLLNEAYKSEYDPIIHSFQVEWMFLKANRALYDYTLAYRKNLSQYQNVFNFNYITPLQFSSKPAHITNIPDLQYLHFPEFFSKPKRMFQYASHFYTLQKAKHVVCISEFVKEDVAQKFGERYRRKLHAAYVPVDFSHFDLNSSQLSYDFDYILSVCAWFPHKNLITLVKAFRIFQEKTGSNLKLLLVGQNKDLKGGRYAAYHQQLQDLLATTPNVMFTGFVSYEDLGALYKGCQFFVFPSLFEGFGIPVVEAMGFGKPVITTRCGSLEEVSKGKAIYLDEPLNSEMLASLMEDLVKKLPQEQVRFEALKEEMRSTYSIEKIARQYLNLFD